MLQTGQVLVRRLSVDFALVLPFKDSSWVRMFRFSSPKIIDWSSLNKQQIREMFVFRGWL
jgi:hypothetical protein